MSTNRSGGRENENLEYAAPFAIMPSIEGTTQPHDHEPIPLTPSLSTTSSQQTPSQTDEEFDDTAWSIYSNTYFLSGGIFYLLATSWDYSIFHSNRDISIDDALSAPQRVLYELLWFMGPLVYLLNSIIDVRWALKVRARDGRRRELEKLLVGKTRNSNINNDIGKPDESESGPSPLGTHADLSALQIEQSAPKRKRRLRKLIAPTKKMLHRMRKHMGHRRDLMAAVTFGIAAFLSVIGAIFYLISTQGEFSFVIHSARRDVEITQGTLEEWAAHLERGSIHMYLVSAVFALWKNPCKSGGGGERESVLDCAGDASWIQVNIVMPISRPFNDVDSMETVGDVFFGLASVVDVILEDSTLDDNVLWWPIASALLWTFDALFYLRGDFVTLFLRKEVLTSGDSEEDVQLSTSFIGLDGDEEEVDGARDPRQVWEYPADGNDASNVLVLS